MEFLKKYWWVFLIIIVLVIIYFATRKPATPSVIIQNPAVTSNQPTNNIAQIIAALGGLSTAIGGWGIFGGSGSQNTGGSLGNGGSGGLGNAPPDLGTGG